MYEIKILSELNDTNITWRLPLRWSQSVAESTRPALYTCIIATMTHLVFWLQFIFSPSVRQKTMQWLYAYLATDILLLLRFFFFFIVHTTSTERVPSTSWFSFVCIIEATMDNYLNILEVYILLALNICRYMQIAYNTNVYVRHVRFLIFAHLSIYLMPLIILIIQIFVGWAQLEEFIGGSCDVAYINVYAQVVNVIFGFALPIVLNIVVLYFNIRYVRLTSHLRRAQHHVSAREKYHRSLVIQFLVFYTVWLLLWSPNVIVYQFTSGISNITVIASLLNYIEIALDPIIIAALDVRFQKVWHKLWIHLIRTITNDRRRITPIMINQNLIELTRVVPNNRFSERVKRKT